MSKRLKFKTTDGVLFKAKSKRTGFVYLIECMSGDWSAMFRDPNEDDGICEAYDQFGSGARFRDAIEYCDENEKAYIAEGWRQP